LSDKKQPEKFIRSLQIGLACLSTFSPQEPRLSLSEVAKANGMNLPTTRRYLETLRALGYVDRDATSKTYQLTPKVLRLGSWVIERMDLRFRLVPYMRAMTRDFDVTTGCCILEGTEIVYIERFRSSDVVNLDLTSGSRLPCHCTSMGKAILAFLDQEKLNELLADMQLDAHTPYTITDVNVLKEDLRVTRERGYSAADQELTLGMTGLAVPIFDKTGAVEASVGVSYPSRRFADKGVGSLLVKKLLEVAEKVSCC